MQTEDSIKVLLTSRDEASMSDFRAGLDKIRVQTAWVKSGSLAIARIEAEDFDLVVTDEVLEDMNGLELIEKVISKKPMINCAAVSTLAPDDFHRASEGLGILTQLPGRPGLKEAEKLIYQLNTILNLARRTNFKVNQ